MSTATCYTSAMRRYRKNGTPIGDRKVYVVKPGYPVQVWEVFGYETWEEFKAGISIEIITGKFGLEDLDDIVFLTPGARLEGKNIAGARLVRCDISGSRMNACRAPRCVFDHSNMSRSVWIGSNLDYSSLVGIDASYGYFRSSSLEKCDLRGSDLTNSNFSYCDLSGADLRDCRTEGANFTGATREYGEHPIPGWESYDGRLRRT